MCASNLLVLKGGGAASRPRHGDRHRRASVERSPRWSPSTPTLIREFDARSEQIREARLKGYEGDACGECGNFTLVRNGTCMKCDTCGGTSGCS